MYVIRSKAGVYLAEPGGGLFTYLRDGAAEFVTREWAEAFLNERVPAARRPDYHVYEQAGDGTEVPVA